MNAIDIIFLIVLVWAIWTGFKKGFIIELFTFLALFLGLYAGIHFSDYVATLIAGEKEVESSYTSTIAFTITFLAVGAMVYFGGKAFEKVIKVVQLSLLNKLLGSFFGLVKGIFLIGAAVMIFDSIDEKNDFIDQDTKDDSLLYYPLSNFVKFCIPAFEESTLFLKEALKDNELIITNAKD